MIENIEDNYPEYLEDERGYRWDAWDVTAAGAIRRHDEILGADAAALAAIAPEDIDDLGRWAYARAARRHGDFERFRTAATMILASDADHPAVAYDEIHVALIEALAGQELFEDARAALARFRTDQSGDTSRTDRLSVFVAARENAPESLEIALDALHERRADDDELMLDVAEDLMDAGHAGHAARALQWAREAADRAGHRAVMVDIDLVAKALGAGDVTEE